MSKSSTSENSNAVGLFPFLAVLLCTMGALLVLLVVMAQHIGKKSPESENDREMLVQVAEVPSSEELQEAEDLALDLEQLQKSYQELQKREKFVKQELQDEKDRLSHLEEHARRLQHKLAKLSIAAKQLESMEQNKTVDSERAEKQLVHLQELVKEKKELLEELRSGESVQKAYAIVPYKGPNGTYRRPIYIECSEDGITLHPEGIKLRPTDFQLSRWAGNPLAAALRASREYLNAKAVRNGESEPPDPYPLILIRPDGIAQFLTVRTAILSWDSDFGYEFIQEDWKLEFPELADPQLAAVQEHAVMMARERLLRLVRSAPSRFRTIGRGGTSASGTIRGDGFGRYGASGTGGLSDEGTKGSGSALESSPDAEFDAEGISSDRYSVKGNGPSNGESSEGSSTDSNGGSSDQVQGDFQVAGGQEANNSQNGLESRFGAMDGSSEQSQRHAQSSTNDGGSTFGSAVEEQGPGAGSSQHAGFGATQNSGPQNDSTSPRTPSLNFSAGQSRSIAESRGKNWAIQGRQRGNVPIRRTIQVVVRKNYMAVLPSRHSSGIQANRGVEIALNKSDQVIADDLTQALQERVKEWGYAGSGLYWRPVLEVHLGPDALHSIGHFEQLLQDSGVELRLPETAQGGANHARR